MELRGYDPSRLNGRRIEDHENFSEALKVQLVEDVHICMKDW